MVVLNGERKGLSGGFRNRRYAGDTCSLDGRWLFFNVQTPGISFAATDPWESGPIQGTENLLVDILAVTLLGR